MNNRNNPYEHYELAYEWFQALDEGQPSRYLAKICGVDQHTIADWRKHKPDWHRIGAADLTKQKIAELLADGQSHSEIARTLHIDVKTVRRHFPGTAWTMDKINDYIRTRRMFREFVE